MPQPPPFAFIRFSVIVTILDISIFIVVTQRIEWLIFSLLFPVDDTKGKGVDLGVDNSDSEVDALVFGDDLVKE